MKKAIQTAIACLGVWAMAQQEAGAQNLFSLGTDSLTDPSQFPVSFYSTIGLPGIFYDSGHEQMHRLLKDRGLSPDRWSPLFWHIGLGIRYKRAHAELFTEFGNDANRSNRSATGQDHYSTRFGNIGLLAGFTFYQNRNNIFLIGGGVVYMQKDITLITTGNGSVIDFDLAGQTVATGVTAWPVMEHASWGADIGLEWQRGRPRRKVLISESFRAGYRFGFDKKPWDAAGAAVLNSPIDRAGLLYLRFSFMFQRNFQQR